MGRRPSSLEDDVFCPRLHPVDERLAFALAEVLIRIVKADADALVQVLPVSDVAGVNGILDALFGCAKSSTSPSHFSQELVALVGLVQPGIPGLSAVR